MWCWFLLYNKVNPLYIYIYPHISSLLRLPEHLFPKLVGHLYILFGEVSVQVLWLFLSSGYLFFSCSLLLHLIISFRYIDSPLRKRHFWIYTSFCFLYILIFLGNFYIVKVYNIILFFNSYFFKVIFKSIYNEFLCKCDALEKPRSVLRCLEKEK